MNPVFVCLCGLRNQSLPNEHDLTPEVHNDGPRQNRKKKCSHVSEALLVVVAHSIQVVWCLSLCGRLEGEPMSVPCQYPAKESDG